MEEEEKEEIRAEREETKDRRRSRSVFTVDEAANFKGRGTAIETFNLSTLVMQGAEVYT